MGTAFSRSRRIQWSLEIILQDADVAGDLALLQGQKLMHLGNQVIVLRSLRALNK